jgi:hypothetical protein
VLAELLTRARDQAKAILAAAEHAGHPQTNESSDLYLGLVTILKRLSQRGAAAPLGEFAPDLMQLAGLCQGRLEPLKPLLEEAVKACRGSR